MTQNRMRFSDFNYDPAEFPLVHAIEITSDFSCNDVLYISNEGVIAAVMVYRKFGKSAHVCALETHADFRNCGLATFLLEELKTQVDTITLHSMPDTIEFYMNRKFIADLNTSLLTWHKLLA